ncbi:MAG: sulfatase-like hydrolase/transferase [Phycisphaerales bacterium]|nr:MAG: sulfatase-like hydrolase/transferase [Phycisphaerales bacterium]
MHDTRDHPAPSKRRRRTLPIAIVAVAAGLAAWRALDRLSDNDPTRPVVLADQIRSGAAAGFNVLLITLDTTRPDHLGCYGYEPARTPTIDSLLEHGVRFDDAVASVPLTLPSHATILTGLGPLTHGVRNNGKYMLSPDHTTLAEILKAQGYETAAFVSCFVLDKRFGLDQGFDVYEFEIGRTGLRIADSLSGERPADEVTTSALKWFQARARAGTRAPFFAWVHYFDPHEPYTPMTQDLPGFPSHPYDGEIAFVDLHLERLLTELDKQKLRDRTLIVLVSDHGEGLDEHGESTHGLFVYETTVRAALVLSCPALFERPYRVDDRVVATSDIVPTVLDLLGVSAGVRTDGISLLATDAPPNRAVYIESVYAQEDIGCTTLHGLRRHNDKYIRAIRPEYYDLRRDPRESDNLYDKGPPDVQDLERRLSDLMASADQAGTAQSAARTLTSEEIRQLQNLGYVGAGGSTFSDESCDPKDLTSVFAMWGEVYRLSRAGRFGDAIPIAEELVAEAPGFELAVHFLAHLQEEVGRLDDAVVTLEVAAKRRPSGELLIHMAELLYRLKRFEECDRALDAAEPLDPLSGSIPKLRGDRLFDQQRYAEAIEQYEKALQIDAERVGRDVTGKLRQAQELLRTARP